MYLFKKCGDSSFDFARHFFVHPTSIHSTIRFKVRRMYCSRKTEVLLFYHVISSILLLAFIY